MRHTRATREQAVARIRTNDKPMLELAREYGISTNTLRSWLRESTLRQRSQEEARRAADTLTQPGHATQPGEPGQPQTATQRDRLLTHAIENSPATIIITDNEGRIVYANPKFVDTTGYAISEVIGKNPRVLKSGLTSGADYRKLWKTILAGNEWRGTFRNRRKDGSLYWERASISPVFDDDGRISHFMAVKEDITDLMETELASRRNAATYLQMLKALPFPVLMIDRNGLLQFFNPAAEILCSFTLTLGHHFGMLNLRWIDADGNALGSDHPLVHLLAGEYVHEDCWTRMGVIPPTGGVRWVNSCLQRLTLPGEREHVALLVLAPETVCSDPPA